MKISLKDKKILSLIRCTCKIIWPFSKYSLYLLHVIEFRLIKTQNTVKTKLYNYLFPTFNDCSAV